MQANGMDNVFKEIITEKFPSLQNEMEMEVQESFKLSSSQDKEKEKERKKALQDAVSLKCLA